MSIHKELIEIFSQKDILNFEVNAKVIDVRGKEESGKGSGVMIDVLGTFYEGLKTSNFFGGNEQVPLPRHDMSKEQWKAVARIIMYGVKRLNYVPLFISKCFILYTMFGEENLQKETLIQGFLEFVSVEEKDVLLKARNRFENVDMDELLDVLTEYKCYSNPTQSNFDNLLAEMSHLHIIQSPKYISNAFSEIFSCCPGIFSSAEAVEKMYETKTPTARKVAKILKFPQDMSPKQQEISSFLMKYVKSLQKESLQRYLRFVTGSDNLPDAISVSFCNHNFRAPCAHVCTNILELDETYICYSELAEEFSNILSNPDSFRFSFV